MSEAAQQVPPGATGANRTIRWSASRGWMLWAVFALVVAVNKFHAESAGDDDVFRIYRTAALQWLAGEPLYNGTGDGVIYLPHAYVVFTPFARLSVEWGGAVWRVLNIGLFAAGVWQLTRLAQRGSARDLFLGVSLPVVLMSWSSARHGQMTMAMGGLMMLAVADLVDHRWWRSTFWLLASLALKPLSVVLVLLAAVLYPRTSWRLVLGAVALLGLPFLLQRPAYVGEQYVLCFRELRAAAEVGVQNEFAQLFWMLQAMGLRIPESAQTVLRMLAAVLTLAAGWLVVRRCKPEQAGLLVFTLAVGYLMLFNPRTERNTYCLLAPSLALFTVQAVIQQQRARSALYLGLIVLFLISHPVGKLLTGGPTVWIKPLLCLIFLAAVFHGLWREWRQEREPEQQPEGPEPILLPLSAHRQQAV